MGPVLYGVGVIDPIGINIFKKLPEHDITNEAVFVGRLLKNVLKNSKLQNIKTRTMVF